MKPKKGKYSNIYLAMTLALFVGGIIFWASDLSSDPPMYYSGMGQSLSTDPAQYVYHAHNKVLFGQFDPFDYARWTVYQHSLVSLLAYIWFSFFGVSTVQAAAVGVLMSFLSLLFLLSAVRRYHSNWVSAAVTLCFVINVTLFTYGRLTYLENGLLLIASIIFWIYSRWGSTNLGLLACGALAAAAMIVGKLFGALLLPCLILVVLFSFSRRKKFEVGLLVGSFLASTALLILIIYGGDFGAAVSYFGEQSYGLRGIPEGLTSPWGFVQHLVSYGFSNRLFYLDPDILLFIAVTLILIALFRSNGIRYRDFSPIARLSILWMAVSFLGLMPLNYSPVRYAVIMLPAVIVGFFATCDQWCSIKVLSKPKFDRRSLLLTGLAFWLLGFHLVMNGLYFNIFPSPLATVVWATLPLAAFATYGFIRLLGERPEVLSRRYMVAALLVVIALSITANAFRIRRTHILEQNFNIVEANRDLAEILGDGAVVSGPYGPAMSMDNDVKSFIHLFGVSKVDSTLFDRYPITHLAVDSSNWAQAIKDYPQLASLTPVTSYWIRDYEVTLYNISQVFDNSEAHAYVETAYERALAAFNRNQPDSALAEIQQFVAANPGSKSGTVVLIDLLSSKQQWGRVRDLLSSLADRYPTDFFLQLQAGRFYQILAHLQQDQSLMSLSQHYYQRGVNVNRYRAEMANRMFAQTMQQLQAAASQKP